MTDIKRKRHAPGCANPFKCDGYPGPCYGAYPVRAVAGDAMDANEVREDIMFSSHHERDSTDPAVLVVDGRRFKISVTEIKAGEAAFKEFVDEYAKAIGSKRNAETVLDGIADGRTTDELSAIRLLMAKRNMTEADLRLMLAEAKREGWL